jgi:hypothetical protein
MTDFVITQLNGSEDFTPICPVGSAGNDMIKERFAGTTAVQIDVNMTRVSVGSRGGVVIRDIDGQSFCTDADGKLTVENPYFPELHEIPDTVYPVDGEVGISFTGNYNYIIKPKNFVTSGGLVREPQFYAYTHALIGGIAGLVEGFDVTVTQPDGTTVEVPNIGRWNFSIKTEQAGEYTLHAAVLGAGGTRTERSATFTVVNVYRIILDSVLKDEVKINSDVTLPTAYARGADGVKTDDAVKITVKDPFGMPVEVSDGKFKADALGTYTITYKATSADKSESDQQVITIKCVNAVAGGCGSSAGVALLALGLAAAVIGVAVRKK